MMERKIVGFFINPIAGMGGSVGLKGTDGMVERAHELGAHEIAPDRARMAVRELFRVLLRDTELALEIVTPGHPMGMEVCMDALSGVMGDLEHEEMTPDGPIKDESQGGHWEGWDERIMIRSIFGPGSATSREDSVQFCKLARSADVDIILFAGGDGTARDVISVVGDAIPILGIPSGVKMHSGVFTYRPVEAGRAVVEFLKGTSPLETREVMDLDEDEYRKGRVNTKLYGYASVPVTTTLQGCKNVIVTPDEDLDRRSIALGLEEFIQDHPGLYVLGAGSTLRDIGDHFGLKLTPLGFDIMQAVDSLPPTLALIDGNESSILESILAVPKENRYIIITPIGAQGFILGRGTQVISEKVLQEIPLENIIVVATPGKLAITDTLRVDVGPFNELLTGYRKVLVGYRRFVLKKVG
jgi:predicted polyphosphate/ATP-dependent NAD kinase